MEYEGRMYCDGNGNLLADERRIVGYKTVTVTDAEGEPMLNGEGQAITAEVPIFKYGKNHDRPIAYDESTDGFRFLKQGEPSHNEQHHKQFAALVGTQSVDPDLPGYAGTKDKPTKNNEHHFGVLEDDPHYEKGATNPVTGVVTNTRTRQLPDVMAVRTGGHTHQHKEAV